MIPHTRFKPTTCLDCGKNIDSATEHRFADLRPQPGDVAICFGCGHIMIYADGDGALRAPTDEEVVEIAGDPDIIEAQKRIALVRRTASRQ